MEIERLAARHRAGYPRAVGGGIVAVTPSRHRVFQRPQRPGAPAGDDATPHVAPWLAHGWLRLVVEEVLLEQPVARVQGAGAVVVEVVLDRLRAIEQALREDRQPHVAMARDERRPPGDAAGRLRPLLVVDAAARHLNDGCVVREAAVLDREALAADGHAQEE